MTTKPATAPGAVPPPANRRNEERISARFAVRFTQTQDAARALRAYSLNLSAGGLCLRTRRSYDVGAQVQLAMEIGGEAFNLAGVIAWVRDEAEAIGVRFINMREEDRVRLQRVLETLKR
jgi:uncharacterized protein (TIGR02266 family)